MICVITTGEKQTTRLVLVVVDQKVAATGHAHNRLKAVGGYYRQVGHVCAQACSTVDQLIETIDNNIVYVRNSPVKTGDLVIEGVEDKIIDADISISGKILDALLGFLWYA